MKVKSKKIINYLLVLLMVFSVIPSASGIEANTLEPAELTVNTTESNGYHTVSIVVPKNNIASSMKLYENNQVVKTKPLTPNSKASNDIYYPVTAKLPGDYTYKCELYNGSDSIFSKEVTVNVSTDGPYAAAGAPDVPQLSKDKWNGENDYSINMNMWWGNNGYAWLLYENEELIYAQDLNDNSPNAQSASKSFTGKTNGIYTYRCELVNDHGTTSSESLDYIVDLPGEAPDLPINAPAKTEPAHGYVVVNESDTKFEWLFYIANPNKEYVWDGTSFDVWSISFDTTSEIASIEGADSFIKEGNTVTINLKGYERVLPFDTTKTIKVKGNKNGNVINPENIKVNLMRGDIPYTQYAKLPSSWHKGKTNLKLSDLVDNTTAYYDTNVAPNTNHLIVYNPVSDTQLIITEPHSVDYPVNGVEGLRMWVPSKFVAMGLGFAQETFRINPHYMCGLGTKENFTFGVVPESSGFTNNPVIIDGETWYCPIQKEHPDGPFQQEAGNFNECKGEYPDYLAPDAKHDEYTKLITGDADDAKYVASAISSAISLTMTREFLYSVPKIRFKEFVENATDPWTEFVCVNYAYNRGVYGFLQKGIFTTHRERALAATDFAAEFELSGFASHVENVRSMIEACNSDTSHIYDTQLTWADFEDFFDQLRLFYRQGVPTDSEWNDMKADVHRAFDVLAQNWGGSTVSLRYDFLTLLRISKAHLPYPDTPNPTGQNWADHINGSNKKN
ncbi:chitinase N-terminal domain-containing protein [Wukongibacter sp. M2B1]|uniref:chitinase N-terminal domain-containing protein n=1 Tax=Wukongibacter sp. M2B1 TaxID=3088895 RepID=UPI003D792A45